MKTVSIANQKGGCGKTTTAINLSSALAALGKKILLIDLDPQSHASYGLGVMNHTVNKSIYNVLTDNSEKRCTINDCIMKVARNLDIAPSNILLSTLEQELKDKDDAVSKLHEVLTTSTLNYDYILIDCPPSLGFLTFNALRAADMVLVPIDMSAFSLMGVAKLLGMLELIKVKISHAPKVNSIATIFDKRTKYSYTMLDEIKALFKDQMLNTIIRMNVALKKAASKGVPVIEFDKDSNGALDHMDLAKELLKADEREARANETRAVIALSSEKPEKDEELTEPKAPEENLSEDSAAETPQEEIASAEDRDLIMDNTVRDMIRGVVFAIKAPEAREIHVVGDFNQWKAGEGTRLLKNENGGWEKRLDLPPGRYKYKFIIDGEWVLDDQNPDREQNSFGTFDSIAKF